MYSTTDCSQRSSANENQVQSCQAIDENTGEICGETEGLRILNKFRRLYEVRIRQVDQQPGEEFDRVSIKLQIMKDWIKDLTEQNVMLVHTVDDLEKVASNRVKQLEDKLKQSSKVLAEDKDRSDQSEETLNKLSNRISELEKDEKYLQQRIGALQNDIKGLLKFISRAKWENQWNLNGITFSEIQPSDLPLDCPCDQARQDVDEIQCLELSIKQLQENERKLLLRQTELQTKLSNLTEELTLKEQTIGKYVSNIQNLSDKLKKHSESANKMLFTSTKENVKPELDIILATEIVEKVLVEKDTEIKNLHCQLQDLKSKLTTHTYEDNMEVPKLQAQLEQKCEEIKQIREDIASLERESHETGEALIAEVTEKHNTVVFREKENAALEQKYRDALMQINFKDDLIREMQKKLKQTLPKDLSREIGLDVENTQEDIEVPSKCVSRYQKKLISYFNNTKILIEKEKEAFSDLKIELENIMKGIKKKREHQQDIPKIYEKLKTIEMLIRNNKDQIPYQFECIEGIKNYILPAMDQLKSVQSMLQNTCTTYDTDQTDCHVNDFSNEVIEKLNKNIDSIEKICSEKEEDLSFVDFMLTKFNEYHVPDNCDNAYSVSNAVAIQQFKLMEEFRVCTVEAQAATEDIREEMNSIVANFNFRHQQYTDLNKLIGTVRDQIMKTREDISEAIESLELKNDERLRHNERIVTSTMRLKDMKNNINHAQSQLSHCINNLQGDLQMGRTPGYMDISTYNDLLFLVEEEVKHILSSSQVFQIQGCSLSSLLTELKSQLCSGEWALKDLEKKANEVLLETELEETTFNEREKKLEKFEEELDNTHSKMQDALEAFLHTKEQDNSSDHTLYSHKSNQITSEILKAKEELHQVRKEYDDLKLKTVQQACQTKYEEKVNQWKCHIAELQDQVKILQHEVKCKQDANVHLKHSIESMETELDSMHSKLEDYRKYHTTDNMELKKRILELENSLKLQKEVESNLRQSLNTSESELKKSKELLDSFHINCETEGTLLHCGYQVKHENTSQLLTTLQDIVQTTKSDLLDLKTNLKKLIYDGLTRSSTPMPTIAVIDKLEMYERNLNSCLHEIENLKSISSSKDKLLVNMDEIIKIQKNSIIMTQAELKDLHRKHQEKIDTQNSIISQQETEKSELIKQNELQVQTIRHLQDAVVEAKRSLDQMGHKSMSDVSDVWGAVSHSTPKFTQRNVHDV